MSLLTSTQTTILPKIGQDKTSIVMLDKITDVSEDEWRANTVKKLNGVIFNDGGGDVLEQTKESRRELERRRLVDCVAFVKGNDFNMVNVEYCNLKSETTINGGETLRVRGRDDLDHPDLRRACYDAWGQHVTCGQPLERLSGSKVRAHHFVMNGDSSLTLINLKLSGAYSGHYNFYCVHNLGKSSESYCNQVSSIICY